MCSQFDIRVLTARKLLCQKTVDYLSRSNKSLISKIDFIYLIYKKGTDPAIINFFQWPKGSLSYIPRSGAEHEVFFFVFTKIGSRTLMRFTLAT